MGWLFLLPPFVILYGQVRLMRRPASRADRWAGWACVALGIAAVAVGGLFREELGIPKLDAEWLIRR